MSSVNHDIAGAIVSITIRIPSMPEDALPYYEGIRDWLDGEISLLQANLVKSERPHETIARIGRETRNAKSGKAFEDVTDDLKLEIRALKAERRS